MNFFKALWEDYKARRRGETRVAPRDSRGRVYTRAKAIGEIRVSRVYRAKEDRWYLVNPNTGALTPEHKGG